MLQYYQDGGDIQVRDSSDEDGDSADEHTDSEDEQEYGNDQQTPLGQGIE